MRFMLTMSFNQAPNEEIKALLPAEQTRVKELSEQGIQESFNVAADQSAAWGVWNCESLDEVQEIFKTLPLHPFLNVDITPLAD